MTLIKNLGLVFKQLFLWMGELIYTCGDLLGIDDIFRNKLVLFGILIVASMLGIYVSARRKNKLWIGINLFFEISSIIGAVFSAQKSK